MFFKKKESQSELLSQLRIDRDSSKIRLTKFGISVVAIVTSALLIWLVYFVDGVINNVFSEKIASDSIYQDIEPLKAEYYRIKVRDGYYVQVEIRTYPSGLMCTFKGNSSAGYVLINCTKRYGDYQ